MQYKVLEILKQNNEPLPRPESNEILDWLENHVTKWFLSEVSEQIDTELTSIANGGTLSNDAHLTNQLTAKANGRMEALNNIVSLLEVEE